MESLRTVPDAWHQVGEPSSSRRLFLRIAMQQPNPGLFQQTIYEVSDPSHARYGQHLTRDELKALTKPNQEASDAVIAWLKDSGIPEMDIEDDGDWINFVANVSKAEGMLDTQFHIYQSSIRPIEKIRTLQYSVPSDLHQYIDMIQPTTRFGQIRAQVSHIIDKKIIGEAGKVTAVNVTCNKTITPSCLRELYNIDFTPDRTTAGFIGINGFLNQYARYADLKKFAPEYAPWVKNASFDWTSVNGGILNQTSTDDAGEADLDIEYTTSLTYPMRNNFYSTAGLGELVPDLDQPKLDQNEPYLEFFTYLTNLPDEQLPHTLSTSYGEDEQSVPANYSKKVCDMIGGLGARGVSIIFSSGDTGVGSACQTNDGKNTTRFNPIFPAACPYVTSVGGTTEINPERAVDFSGGGFSDRFPIPDYQAAAVKKYLGILGTKWNGLYNPQGRGFPDLAAQSIAFRIITQGLDEETSGTSASTPTVAGIVALLNAARKEKGMPTLGFLNPWLYSTGVSGLNDIVDGGSTGCTGIDHFTGGPTPKVPFASWNATEGWDPVTGLGTPDFAKLLSLSMSNGSSTSSKSLYSSRSMRWRER
ncbi:subtilisin-like protein [Rhizodiscina lignyota]|uniref:tripeptidyl-peptidase II n=1 Tax=Rhizodiscina lignyota TaxID=1504668 RepID=A0A9P4IJ96_9PEZI|nr:subtilisin-like protein [Rhizodiscina lignyota]